MMKIKDLFRDKDVCYRPNTLITLKDKKLSSKVKSFVCSFNRLVSLKGSPREIDEHFDCSYNKLTSLEGGPELVGEDFNCSRNQLTSLKGSPKKVGKNFICSNNQLTSLKDIHKQIHEINGSFWAIENPIKSHVLGLLKIKGLKKVWLDNKEVQDIINDHLGQGNAGLIKAQRELIEEDLDDYAEL